MDDVRGLLLGLLIAISGGLVTVFIFWVAAVVVHAIELVGDSDGWHRFVKALTRWRRKLSPRNRMEMRRLRGRVESIRRIDAIATFATSAAQIQRDASLRS